MTTRRSFVGLIVGFFAGPLTAQRVVMEGHQAVPCKDNAVKCPNGHMTCPTINMPIAIGNDSYEYEEVHQLRDFKVLCCDVCGVLFVKK